MSSYSRQTQSKAQNEANARALRALVKQPDNKVCADCKRNDPRWASWNIGCFLCIRCSGIHRSMGTHISKVKSIDLDIWTPEQMESVQKWGNKRCNLYWEAHLKAGHVPPDHKVESFIRSKYEMKRWAKEGPPDPTTLDDEGSSTPTAASASAPAPANAPSSSSRGSRAAAAPSAIDLLGGGDIGPGPATTSVSRPRQSVSLLDDPPAPSPSRVEPTSARSPPPAVKAATGASAGQAGNGGGGGLFDLDWHAAPTSPSAAVAQPAKGNKSDILSLFSATSPRPSAPASAGLDSFGSLNLGGQQSSGGANPWGLTAEQQPATQASGAPRGSSMFSTQDVWGTSTTGSSNPSTMNNDIWGEMTSSSASNNTAKPHQESKNDAFADIWK